MRYLVSVIVLMMGACVGGVDPGDDQSGGVAAAQEQLGRNGDRGRDGCWVNHWVVKDERAPFVPQDDVDLIDALVPHHRAAIEMADIEIAKGSHPEVVAMAERMRADQMAEISELLAIREDLTGCSDVPPLRDRHMPVDMADLETAQGLEVDLRFLEHMIPHHAGAVQFTHNALPNLHDERLRSMATEIVDKQSMEIGEMHAMKMQLEAATDPADAGP